MMLIFASSLILLAPFLTDAQDLPDITGFMNFPFAERRFPSSVFGEPPRGFMHKWRGPHFHGISSPHGGLKTKVRNETKGNMKVEEVEKDGDGYHSFSRLTTFNEPNAGKGGIIMEGKNEQKFIDEITDNVTKREECNGKKPCPTGKFCHPISMSCVAQVKDGEDCFMKDQCSNGAKGIKCIFGKCREGKDGQPGTICSTHKECTKDCCCTPGTSGIRMCRTRLAEGAVCTQSIPFTGLFGFEMKRSKESCNPCRDGLKCVETAGFLFGERSCLPEKFAKDEKNENDEMDDPLDAADDDSPEADISKPSDDKEASDATDNSAQQPNQPQKPLNNILNQKQPLNNASKEKIRKTKKEAKSKE